MKFLAPVLAALLLFAANVAAFATVTDADLVGRPAPLTAAQRTIPINPGTKWVTVERGEVVKFVAKGQEFAWAFDAMASSFDLEEIAPAGTVDRKLMVYIWPNAGDVSNN